jgi:hypothetical protein
MEGGKEGGRGGSLREPDGRIQASSLSVEATATYS